MSKLLCFSADKILIFVVLKWWLLQQIETEHCMVFRIFTLLLGKILLIRVMYPLTQ